MQGSALAGKHRAISCSCCACRARFEPFAGRHHRIQHRSAGCDSMTVSGVYQAALLLRAWAAGPPWHEPPARELVCDPIVAPAEHLEPSAAIGNLCAKPGQLSATVSRGTSRATKVGCRDDLGWMRAYKALKKYAVDEVAGAVMIVWLMTVHPEIQAPRGPPSARVTPPHSAVPQNARHTRVVIAVSLHWQLPHWSAAQHKAAWWIEGGRVVFARCVQRTKDAL